MKKVFNLLKPRMFTKLRLEGIQSRFLFMIFDAVVTAPLRPRKKSIEHIRHVLDRRSRNFDKVPSMVNIVDNIIPGTSKRLFSLLCNSNKLPLNSTSVTLIDYGTGATVFLLEIAGDYKILKIYRKSLGKRLRGLIEVVHEFERKYETVSSWYNNDFDIVVPSRFLILNGPILGHPVATVLQPYVHGYKQDLFKDFSNEQLIALMNKDEDLKQQFISFGRKTISVYSSERIIDVLGRNNVMLVHHGNNWRIIIVDNGFFDLANSRIPDKIFEIEAHVSRIKFLLAKVDSHYSYHSE